MPSLLSVICGLLAATFIYIPNELETAVVPHGDFSRTYALESGDALMAWPWNVAVYNSSDKPFSWVSFSTSDSREVTVVLRYPGTLVDFLREWEAKDEFLDYWVKRCHRELDPVFASLAVADADTSLGQRCAIFLPVEEQLTRLSARANVSLKLSSL
jgi:hypothetical protein